MLVIVIESRHLHTLDEKGGSPGGAGGGSGAFSKEEDVHEVHPVLRQRLTPKDKCWQTEPYAVVEECDRCTGESGEWGREEERPARTVGSFLWNKYVFYALVCLHKNNFKKTLVLRNT